MLDEVRDVGHADQRCAESVGGVGGLVDLLTADGEGFSVERGVAAVPEDGAVGLVGVEVAEVAAPSESASSAPAKATASAESAASSSSAASASTPTAGASTAGLRRSCLSVRASGLERSFAAD